ncbi:MAG: chorismate-binding protein, partial [Isosphaeraceae bacterium]
MQPPRHQPTFDQFRGLIGQARRIPVYRQLTSDGLTPVSAFRKVHRGGHGFLFESVIGGEKVGRFSFLGTESFLQFEAKGNEVRETQGGQVQSYHAADPFEALRKIIESNRAVHLPELPRFSGGAVGFASYDSVRYSEHLPDAPPDDRALPDLAFNFYDRMVIFDHIRKTVLVVALADVGPDSQSARAAFDDACQRIDELVARLSEPGPELPLVDIDTSGPVTLQPKSNFTKEQYEAVVRRCQGYIKAGDIFQVVPSQRFAVETNADPFDIYRVLRVVNPSP